MYSGIQGFVESRVSEDYGPLFRGPCTKEYNIFISGAVYTGGPICWEISLLIAMPDVQPVSLICTRGPTCALEFWGSGSSSARAVLDCITSGFRPCQR